MSVDFSAKRERRNWLSHQLQLGTVSGSSAGGPWCGPSQVLTTREFLVASETLRL